MPKKVPEEAWVRYFKFRDSMTSHEAALCAGINKTTAWRLENVPNHNSSGRKYLEAWRAKSPGSITDKQRLNTQAKRALNDFAYFRLRYFGRKSTPWQVETAQIIAQAYDEAQATMERKFIVLNCPPGAGKSTLVSHDIPTWLLCRDRALRILIGSASENIAAGYTDWIMTDLERQAPPPLSSRQQAYGATQAESCLVEDFGRFKPSNGRNWKAKAFRIAQPGDVEATGKEVSVTAFGRDSSYLGQRVDIALWDDLVTQETMGTQEARDKTLRKWQAEAEQRVEPGGVLFLIGQRLFADDLYRYCIDLPADIDDDDDDEVTGRKYTHIVFKAHYDELCKGDHGKTAKPYDPAHPETSGCLLEPLRLGWKHLREQISADEQNGTSIYRVSFQQEDGDPSNLLVNPLWVEGGEDKKTGERFPGCWDEHRVAGVVPKVIGAATSILSVDSSPSKFWACGWWMHHPESERRFLIDLERKKMKVTDAVAYNKDTGVWTGLFEDWWWSASRQGRPITWLIFEAVAAEKYFLDSPDLLDWARLRGVHVIKHDTHRNKTNPEYGMQIVGPVYRLGRVRLPGDPVSGSKGKVMQLVREVTRWPEASTEDCAMMQWFVEHNLSKLGPKQLELPAQPRPSWLSSIPDGRALQLVASR